jgi:Protein of unknown function (DUF642)
MRFTSVRGVASFAILAVAACSGRSLVPTEPLDGSSISHASQNTGLTAERCPRWPGGTGILRDGDFRDAKYPSGAPGFVSFFKGQKFTRSWIVTIGGIDFIGSFFQPPHGVCSIDLDGSAPGSKGGRIVGAIAHAPFKTTAKRAYTVTFLLSGNGACGPTVKRMKVATENASKIFDWNISNGHDAQSGDFSQRSWTFTASSSQTQLTLSSLDKPTTNLCGPVVAAVRVVAK